ncbi:MAG: hypothetical protein ACK4GN_04130 [Runella sp.]
MKNYICTLIAWCMSLWVHAQVPAYRQAEVLSPLSPQSSFDLKSLFDDSENFITGRNAIWGNYGLLSNRGQRPARERTILPSLDLQYERQLWKNLGLRAALGSNWWEEKKLLAESNTDLFYERFRYQYWTLGGGFTWHFNVNAKWDPYIGLLASLRWGRASCVCYAIDQTGASLDLFLGTRYLLARRFFVMGEVGRHQTSYVKLGTGFKF